MTENQMNIYQKINILRSRVDVPKDKRNDFGGFNYRSAEDIMAAMKPITNELGLFVHVDEDIVIIAEKTYLKCTITVIDVDAPDDNRIVLSAFAREEEVRPKMGPPQLTGSSSSYARKYALQALLLLDDNRDPDEGDREDVKKASNGKTPGHKQQPQPTNKQSMPEPKPIWQTWNNQARATAWAVTNGLTEEEANKIYLEVKESKSPKTKVDQMREFYFSVNNQIVPK